MHRPLVEVLTLIAMLSLGALFSGAAYLQGRSAATTASEASSLSMAVQLASACLQAAEIAKLSGSQANATIIFPRAAWVNADGMEISVDSAKVRVQGISVSNFNKSVRWLNVTANPDGTVVLIGG